MNVETILFTHQPESLGQAFGKRLAVTHVEAGLFPEDKVCKLTALQRGGRKVALLSNGIDGDAALLQADVSVLTGSTEGHGDMLFTAENLAKFGEVLAIARAVQRTMTTNLILTILVTSLCIGTAMAGVVPPAWAIAIRFTSELVLVLNAARLLPSVGEREQKTVLTSR